MRTVWRYPLALGRNVVVTPPGSKLLSAAWAHESFQVWFEVDPRLEPTEDHVLDVLGTGREIPRGMVHFATLIVDEFVFHVYDARTGGVAARIVARDAEHATT